MSSSSSSRKPLNRPVEKIVSKVSNDWATTTANGTASGVLSPSSNTQTAPSNKKTKREIFVIEDDDEEENGADHDKERRVRQSVSNSNQRSHLLKQELNAKLLRLDDELRGIDDQINELRMLRSKVLNDKTLVEVQLQSLASGIGITYSHSHSHGNGANSAAAPGIIDYTTAEFEWSTQMKRTMNAIFGIKEFRFCQEGVCNAAMEGRDIVSIMPTGGGKSLTYQLPALLSRGTTIVVSPLLSLMSDQIFHLRDAGIEAIQLSGITSKTVEREYFQKLSQAPEDFGGYDNNDDGEKPIKIVYVTPEKVSKSKSFLALLQKMYKKGLLARIVIDEAHCVSQMGHDYRPDYKKLSMMKKLFPTVPITAVTATCSRKVLPDLLNILNLGRTTPSEAAESRGTVFFTSPLYRKNLHYQVLEKPAAAKEVIASMSAYILQHHRADSGIIYCLSKKDTEAVAEGLRDESGGVIKADVYHADKDDGHKQRLHLRWREGKIRVVVATIAFGLGIDKPDLRYVMHHSISKSLDGFYQETGRAGRDGKDASCILWYRPQDATRMSSLTAGDQEGSYKLRDMLEFAQDKTSCRKKLFGKYFNTSASLPSTSWSGANSTIDDSICGHCDNCTREPNSVIERDVTLEAWKILKIVGEIAREDGRVTISSLTDLSRGGKGGTFGVTKQPKRKKMSMAGEKSTLNLDELCGGKITLSKIEVEYLIVHLLLHNYLQEEYAASSYTINVYVSLGPGALRLSRLSQAQVQSGQVSSAIKCAFLKPVKRAKISKSTKNTYNADLASVPPARKSKVAVGGKGKDKAEKVEEEDNEGEIIDLNYFSDDEDEGDPGQEEEDDIEDSDVDLRRPRKKTRQSIPQPADDPGEYLPLAKKSQHDSNSEQKSPLFFGWNEDEDEDNDAWEVAEAGWEVKVDGGEAGRKSSSTSTSGTRAASKLVFNDKDIIEIY